MKEHVCPVLSPFERDIAAKIEADFRVELELVYEAQEMIESHVRALFRSQDVFIQPNPMKQLRLASSEARKLAAWTMLVGEAFERFNSGLLLLRTGHHSRSVACVRDGWESIEWGEICRRLAWHAERWVAGKGVEAPKQFKFPAMVPRLLDGESAEILNTYGTHPYIKAAFLSVFPASFDDPDDSSSYQEMTRMCLVTLLFVFGLMIEYLDWRASGDIAGASDLVERIRAAIGAPQTP